MFSLWGQLEKLYPKIIILVAHVREHPFFPTDFKTRMLSEQHSDFCRPIHLPPKSEQTKQKIRWHLKSDIDFLKSEHSFGCNPPIHPNLNIVRILKSVDKNGCFLGLFQLGGQRRRMSLQDKILEFRLLLCPKVKPWPR